MHIACDLLGQRLLFSSEVSTLGQSTKNSYLNCSDGSQWLLLYLKANSTVFKQIHSRFFL